MERGIKHIRHDGYKPLDNTYKPRTKKEMYVPGDGSCTSDGDYELPKCEMEEVYV